MLLFLMDSFSSLTYCPLVSSSVILRQNDIHVNFTKLADDINFGDFMTRAAQMSYNKIPAHIEHHFRTEQGNEAS